MLGNVKQEKSKLELSLGTDSFDKPQTLSDAEAWSQLILDLIFLVPGTYPSLPLMGVGIEQYEFEFVDDMIDKLPRIIKDQQESYLPDIPVSNINVQVVPYNGTSVLLIQMSFNTSNGLSQTAIASAIDSGKIINVEVSWGS